jgi:hypothetical protein
MNMEVQSPEMLERLAILVADRLANVLMPRQPILARIPDAAAMIGRGMTFIYEAIADGRIKAVKSDGRTLVVISSLHEYAASLPAAKITYAPKRYAHRKRGRREAAP